MGKGKSVKVAENTQATRLRKTKGKKVSVSLRASTHDNASEKEVGPAIQMVQANGKKANKRKRNEMTSSQHSSTRELGMVTRTRSQSRSDTRDDGSDDDYEGS